MLLEDAFFFFFLGGKNGGAPGKHIGYKTNAYPIMHQSCCFDVVLLLREDVVLMSRGLHGGARGKRKGYNTSVYCIMHENTVLMLSRCCFDVVLMLREDVVLMSRGQNWGPPRKHITCGWCLRRQNGIKTTS